MKIYRCDICGKESRTHTENTELVFTSIKRRHWAFVTYREEILDVCEDCQQNFRAALDKKAREE